MDAQELLTRAQDVMTVRRVFGDPVQVGGVTLVPAARVSGGGGGGGRGSEDGGAGFGVHARPVGAFVIKGDDVAWRPAVNVNAIIAGGQLVAAAAVIVLGPAIVRWLRTRDSDGHRTNHD